MFAIDTAQAARWWVRPLLAGADVFPMDPTRPMATKSLVKALRDGRQCVIFPEGRLNVTGGALMKIYDGPALIADKGEAMVLPVRIDGVEFTPFSRLASRRRLLRRRWFPKVTITLLRAAAARDPGRAARPGAPAPCRARALRHHVGDDGAARRDPPSLFAALLDARRAHGGKHPIARRPDRRAARLRPRVAREPGARPPACANARRRARRSALMVPNSIGAAVAFLALAGDRPGAGDAEPHRRRRRRAVGLPHRRAAHRRHLAPLYRTGQARRPRRPPRRRGRDRLARGFAGAARAL